ADKIDAMNGDFQSGGNTITVTGSGTNETCSASDSMPFCINIGNMVNSTLRYKGTGATKIMNGDDFYNVELIPASGSPTYTIQTAAQTMVVTNNLLIGDGTNAVTLSTAGCPDSLIGSMTVSSGAVLSGAGTCTMTVTGNVTGDGTINRTAGTVLIDGTGNFGGNTAWTFANLTFGDGSGTTTINTTGSGGITITGV